MDIICSGTTQNYRLLALEVQAAKSSRLTIVVHELVKGVDSLHIFHDT